MSDNELWIILDGLTWQCRGNDEWIFGEMVRGIVRKPVGEIYLDEEQKQPWVWFLRWLEEGKVAARGRSNTFQWAVDEVEKSHAARLLKKKDIG